MPAPDARLIRYPDGTVVFDPVSGRIRVLGGESHQILEWLRDRIEGGVDSPADLVACLKSELAHDDPDVGPDADEADDTRVEARLLDWVELALHLYA